MRNTYLFIGDYKYWLMTHWDDIDLDGCPDDYVLNRARLYRDRRDFVIQSGRHRPAGGLSGQPRAVALTMLNRQERARG